MKLTKLILHLAVSAAVAVLVLLASWQVGRAGFATLLSTYASKSNKMSAAQAALRLSPNDPETHYVRGAILESNGDLAAAVDEYTQAARLRSDDYVLWMALARARELTGNTAEALAAARQGVVLAPNYSQPHWQLGNMLVRSGQLDEGFRELRRAGDSDPRLLPTVIDLAWQLSGGDSEFVKRTIQPQSPDSCKALAEYFKKRGKVTDAIEMFRAAGDTARQERLLFLEELVTARRFNEAAVLWSMDHPEDLQNMISKLHNPGFEQESSLSDPGFDWRQDNKSGSLSLSLDLDRPKEGRSSLRVDFNGDSDLGPSIISQLILVEPGTQYHLQFAARTEGLVSGGLPYVSVSDAGDGSVLGQTGLFPRQTVGWQDYVLDFKSGENAGAIQLMLRRVACSKSPCPIFGHLWLDNFLLLKQ